jgi:hypothetical protein
MAFTFRAAMASVVSIATGTLVGDWLDVGDYNELYAWLDTSVAAFSGATLIVTIERQAENAAGYVTIATFTTVNTNATTTEEETVTSLIGGRIRYRAVLGGTFGAGETRTWTLKMQAKCA